MAANKTAISARKLASSFVGPGEVLSAGIMLPVRGMIVVALRFWLRSYQRVGLQLQISNGGYAANTDVDCAFFPSGFVDL